ncbi:unnamed protein product, partial [Didymodactylos carnosus]
MHYVPSSPPINNTASAPLAPTPLAIHNSLATVQTTVPSQSITSSLLTTSSVSQILNDYNDDLGTDDLSTVMKAAWDPHHCADWDQEQPNATCIARIKRDIMSVFRDPPPGMFIAPSPDNITKIHALIVGPFDTPYEGGFFYFLIRCPPDYPIRSPRVKLMTTGNNTVRFNPNLYRNGKVCLSILGTWSGPSWSPAQCISSLLISIQSLMSDKPYHNEPGFEHERTTGDSKVYNDIIRHETLRVAVCEMLENENSCPKQLREVMIKQFLDFYDVYSETCTENLNKDGTQMIDPFGDRRGLYEYGTILARLKKLKARFQVQHSEKSQQNNNQISAKSSTTKCQQSDSFIRQLEAEDPNRPSDYGDMDDIFDEPSDMDDDDDEEQHPDGTMDSDNLTPSTNKTENSTSPICDKESIDGSNNRLSFGASSMQGWRMSQEDAHNAILDFDPGTETSFFAVYDGHGGSEIALYCSKHLPDFIKQLDSYRENRLSDALIEGFMKFDAVLLDPHVKEILQDLASSKDNDQQHQHPFTFEERDLDEVDVNEDDVGVEEAKLLKRDADVPIEELLKRYGATQEATKNEFIKHFHSPKNLVSSRRKIHSTFPVSSNGNDNEEDKLKQSTLKKLHDLRQNVLNEDEIEEQQPNNESDDNAVSSTTNIESKEKIELLTTTNDENIIADDVLDHKIAQQCDTTDDKQDETVLQTKKTTIDDDNSSTKTNDSAEQPSSSGVSSASSPSNSGRLKKSSTTTITSATTSLTHHLLDDSDDFDVEEDEDDDEYETTSEEDDENDDEKEEDEVEEEEEEEEHAEDKDQNVTEKKQLAIKKKFFCVEDMENDDENESSASEDEDDDELSNPDLSKILDMNGDPGSTSGCTAVVAILRNKQLYVGNAGDSRCVVSRDGKAIEMST